MPPTEPAARPTGNPYVGPRAFLAADKDVFFGRDHEVAELADLLRAERVVFLHAPAGAGKTSLINAGLIPTLKDEFDILPPVRVGAAERPNVNRYVFSTLASLDTAGEGSQVRPVLGDPSALSIDAYLRARPAADPCGRPQLLIFDQFEEILTLDPFDPDAKKTFFRELGVVLRKTRQYAMADGSCPVDPTAAVTRWALFAIRDEYVAALLPYFRLLPAGLGETYRLERLSRSAALESVVKPAEARGVSFEPGAAEELVDRLSMVRPFIDSDRSTVEPPSPVPSEAVEPVFLQIVCQRLWDDTVGSDASRKTITRSDVGRVGGVQNSLGRYYRDQVRAVAAAIGVDEGRVRAWVGQRLISPRHQRVMVVRGSDEYRELGDEPVRKLEQAYLLRREARTTGIIYELAHDCLIGPVEDDNAAYWAAQPRGVLQPKADLWLAQKRRDEELLTDAELREAEAWADQYAGRVRPLDQQFLEASRKEAAVRRFRRWGIALAFAAVGVVLALVLGWLADRQIQRVQQQADRDRLDAENRAAAERAAASEKELVVTKKQMDIVQGRRLVARALNLIDTDPEGAVDAAVRAMKNLVALPDSDEENAYLTPDVRARLRADAADSVRRAESVLNLCIQAVRCRQTLTGHQDEVNAVAVAAGGNRFATGDGSGLIRVWNRAEARANWPAKPTELPSLDQSVSGLAFDPLNANQLASAGDGGVHLWDLSASPPTSRVVAATGKPAVTESYSSVAFSHAGNFLAASTGRGGTVLVWDLANPREPRLVRTLSPVPRRRWGIPVAGAPSVARVAFAPVPDADGKWVLASAWTDGRVRVWRQSDEADPWKTIAPAGTADALRSVAFDSGGRRVATASEDGAARVWDMATGELVQTCYASQDRVNDVAFGVNDTRLVSVTRDREVQVWQVTPDGRGRGIQDWFPLARLQGHHQIVTAAAFLGSDVVSVSDDRTVKVWRPDETAAYFGPFELHRESVRRMVLSPGGEVLAAVVGGPAERVVVWDAGPNGSTRLKIDIAGVTALAFDPTGQTLVLARDPGELHEYKRTPDGFAFDRVRPIPALLRGADPSLGWVTTVRVQQVRFSPDGRYLAAACAIDAGGVPGRPEGVAVLWDTRAADLKLLAYGPGRKLFWDVAVSPDGRWFAATANTGITHLRALGPGSRALLKYTPGPPGGLGTAAVVEEEKSGDSGSVYAAAFNEAGTRLATAHHDGAIVVWRLGPDGPRKERVLPSGTLAVRCLAFLPGTEWLAAGSYDRTVRVWDLDADSGGPIYTLSGPRGWVTEVVWQPTRDLLVLSTDKSVRRYFLNQGRLRDAAGQAITEPGRFVTEPDAPARVKR